MEDADFVQIAAHGRFRADSPMFSHLALADGPLTVYDLERLRSAPEVVTLSACEAASSRVYLGDEILGTASVLLGLGVRTVVAPLVEVPDEATTRLMVAMHGQLGDGAAVPPRAAAGGRPRWRRRRPARSDGGGRVPRDRGILTDTDFRHLATCESSAPDGYLVAPPAWIGAPWPRRWSRCSSTISTVRRRSSRCGSVGTVSGASSSSRRGTSPHSSKAIDRFWDAGRPMKWRAGGRRRRATTPPMGRDPRAIRVWAAENGIAVPSRRGIPETSRTGTTTPPAELTPRVTWPRTTKGNERCRIASTPAGWPIASSRSATTRHSGTAIAR